MSAKWSDYQFGAGRLGPMLRELEIPEGVGREYISLEEGARNTERLFRALQRAYQMAEDRARDSDRWYSLTMTLIAWGKEKLGGWAPFDEWPNSLMMPLIEAVEAQAELVEATP